MRAAALWSLLWLDLRLAWRGRLFAVTLALGAVMAGAVRIFAPAELGGAHELAELAAAWAAEGGRLTTLRPQAQAMTLQARLVPAVICLDVLVVGFFFGGVMLLQEKALRTLAAYRVSPGGAGLYVTSKVLVNLLMALLYTALVLVIVPPAGASIGAIAGVMGVVSLGSATCTLGGIALAAPFRGLSSFFYPAAIASMVLSAAVPAYVAPAFATEGMSWIRALPTYQAFFALCELLGPGGRAGVLPGFLWISGVGLVITAALAWWLTARRVMQEVA